MKRRLQLATVLSTTALLGCSQFALAPSESGPKTAASSSRTSQDALARLFQQGRDAYSAGQLAQAEGYFNHVVWQDPRHLGALNALAVVHAQSGRGPLAVAYFERALAVDPLATHVHNNLGYALLLQGRLDEAETALKRAMALQPDSLSTRDNLAQLALARQRQDATPQMAATDPTPVPTSPPAPATTAADAAPVRQLVAISPNVYELRDKPPAAATQARAPDTTAPAAAVAVTPIPAPVSAAVAPPTRSASAPETARPPAKPLPVTVSLNGVRIEVSNGVGIRHLAKRTADRLAPLGVITARLTNQPSYTQARTEIQYGAPYRGSAEALAQQLPAAIRLLPTQSLGPQIQMRLVLGHDGAGKAILAWLEQQRATQEAQAELAAEPAPAPAQTVQGVVPASTSAAAAEMALNANTGWRWS